MTTEPISPPPPRHLGEAQQQSHEQAEHEVGRCADDDGAAVEGNVVHAAVVRDLLDLEVGERAGRDVGEGDDHVNEADPDEEEEGNIGRAGHVLADDFGDAAGAVADRGEKAAGVVDAADEDRAEDDPEERGEPPEREAGENRAHDGSGGGDRGEVPAEDHGGGGGDIVIAIFHLDGRRRARGIEAEPVGDEPTVGEIGDDQYHRADGDDREDGHAVRLLGSER
jgi:hypothetical protein